MPSGPRTIELWHLGTKRCVLTALESGPPFVVALYDRDTLSTERIFDDHDEATTCAVDALRAAVSEQP